MLNVEGIDLYYGASHILRGVSLATRPGTITCVLGRNGVGKTSLMRAITGLQLSAAGGSGNYIWSDPSSTLPAGLTISSSGLVTGTPKDRARMEVAKALGADFTIDVEKEDPLARIMEITGGKGVDVALDCTAGAGTIPILLGIEALKRKGGTIVVQGEMKEFPNFPLEKVTVKFITIKSARGHSFKACELALAQLASRRLQSLAPWSLPRPYGGSWHDCTSMRTSKRSRSKASPSRYVLGEFCGRARSRVASRRCAPANHYWWAGRRSLISS